MAIGRAYRRLGLLYVVFICIFTVFSCPFQLMYLLHPSKYPLVQIPRDRIPGFWQLRPLLHFFSDLQCYAETCSTPDSGINLNEEQLEEEEETKEKRISLAPGPDTVYFAGKHQTLVRREGEQAEEEDDDDIPLGESFWLDS